jgi:hypothetical protein
MLAASARVVLAVVLATAAVAKLRRRDRVRSEMVSLVRSSVAGPVAVGLPFVELGLAAMLLAWWGSAIPGVLTGSVIGVFTVVLVRALARRLPCPCFGGGSARPVGPLDVFRNGVLLGLAVIATG